MIISFMGPYRWLSNFHICDIEYEGIVYPSTEHAYQAAKSTDPVVRQYIAELPRPADAKRFSRQIKVRPDWDDIKYQVMLDVCTYKFTKHKDLTQKLLETGDQELIEGNTWGDVYWGVYAGQGENNLGKILMHIRNTLKNENSL